MLTKMLGQTQFLSCVNHLSSALQPCVAPATATGCSVPSDILIVNPSSLH